MILLFGRYKLELFLFLSISYNCNVYIALLHNVYFIMHNVFSLSFKKEIICQNEKKKNTNHFL